MTPLKGKEPLTFSVDGLGSLLMGPLNKILKKLLTAVTIGVLNRVEQLADRPIGYVPKDAIPFKTMLPLSEIIAKLNNIAGISTKKVWGIYNALIEKHESEMNILLNVTKNELEKTTNKELAKAIIDNRNGKIKVNPGYDGKYGYATFKK